MARKVRTWRCPCCKVSWSRYKGDDRPPFKCHVCHVRLVAGRVYTAQKRCKHVRANNEVTTFNQKMRSKPRTSAQRVLNPSKEVRAAWSAVRKAKTKPAIMRRAEIFLGLLLEETTRRPSDDMWTTRKKLSEAGSVTIVRHWATWGAPKLIARDDMPKNLYGQFSRGFAGASAKNEIIINVKHVYPDPTMLPRENLRSTIVHEILHVLDANADIETAGHDRYWDMRMKRMYELFPPTDFGRRTT